MRETCWVNKMKQNIFSLTYAYTQYENNYVVHNNNDNNNNDMITELTTDNLILEMVISTLDYMWVE